MTDKRTPEEVIVAVLNDPVHSQEHWKQLAEADMTMLEKASDVSIYGIYATAIVKALYAEGYAVVSTR